MQKTPVETAGLSRAVPSLLAPLRQGRYVMVYLIALVCSTILLLSTDSSASAAAWLRAESMNLPRWAHTATLLPDGRVLVAGGETSITGPSCGVAGDVYDPRGELYNPLTGHWTFVAPMNAGRAGAKSILLTNGFVLLVGGVNCGGVLPTAELYNPLTDAWLAAASMTVGRADFHSATLLSDGRVLVTGGFDGRSTVSSAELYDPLTDRWTIVASMSVARKAHTITLLSDGRVLAAGGISVAGNYLASAEIYDPVLDQWSPGGAISIARSGHTATSLTDGRILVTGGFNQLEYLKTVDIYDPATNTWSPAPSMLVGRYLHTATLLTTGEILVTGGDSNTAEIFSSVTHAWSPAPEMSSWRYVHTATRMADGRVLVAGGLDQSSPSGIDPISSTTEIYTPAQSPPPVVLVHGWCGSPSTTTWGNMLSLLQVHGLPGDYAHYANDTQPDIPKLVESLRDEIHRIRDDQNLNPTGSRQVDVVAHSMGGLVVRAWIAGMGRDSRGQPILYSDEIRRLIMVATPHYGTSVDVFTAAILGSDRFPCASTGNPRRLQADQMDFAHNFLGRLHQTWQASAFANEKQADILTIVGLTGGPLTHLILPGLTDGVVPVASASLDDLAVRARFVHRSHRNDIVNIDTQAHETFILTKHFLTAADPSSSDPSLLECGADTCLRGLEMFTGVDVGGMLKFQLVDGTTRTPLRLRQPPTVRVDGARFGGTVFTRLTSGVVTLLVMPSGAHDIDVAAQGYIRRSLSTVINLGHTTVFGNAFVLPR